MGSLSHIIIPFVFLFTSTGLYSFHVANFEKSDHNSYIRKVFIAQQDSVDFNFKNEIKNAADDSLKILRAYYEFGQYLDVKAHKNESIKNLKIAFKIAKQIKDDEQIAKIGNYLASTYWEVGVYQASIDTYITAYESAVKTKDSSQIAKISMNLATNYNYLGDYNLAIKYALNALKVKETTKDWERICYHYVSMASIFKETDNLEKWEYYIQKAHKMKGIENCASLGDIAKIYNNLGSISARKGETELALIYFDSLMVLSKEVNFHKGISAALRNSADVYKELNQTERALQLLREAEDYFSDPYEEISNNNSKAELYRLLGQDKKALALVKQNTSLKDLKYYSAEHEKTLNLLYKLNVKLLNYKAAFKWNDSLRTLEKILKDEKVRQGIVEMETKYETKKKEQQIELLTAENELKNQRINIGVLIMVFLIVLIILILHILHIKNKHSELIQNSLRLQVLRTQMNPHFIFNALGSIQNFMMKNNSRKASHYLSQFASLTRATLNNSSAETISLAAEIKMIENYLALEKMRKQNKFNYTINYKEDLDIDFIRIPPMLNQPFVENAIKHGFKDIEEGGLLSITITDKNNWIEFIIEDNGHGLPKETTHKKYKSMAMTIFEGRRRLIKKNYKKDFRYKILNLKDKYPSQTGVRITLNIPILNHD